MNELNVPVEQWRPVVGFEGWYEVSDLGQVRGVDRLVEYRDGRKPRLWHGVLLRQQLDKDGYLVVALRRSGVRRVIPVHTLVLEAFVGPKPAGTECCHEDGDQGNAKLDNLRWDTHGANLVDQVRHGTHWQLRKQRCPQGHELVEPNRRRDGSRSCLACNRAAANVSHHRRQHGRELDFKQLADEHYARIMA